MTSSVKGSPEVRGVSIVALRNNKRFQHPQDPKPHWNNKVKEPSVDDMGHSRHPGETPLKASGRGHSRHPGETPLS